MYNEGWSKHAFTSPSLHSLMLNHHSPTPYHILFHNLPAAQPSSNPPPSTAIAPQKHTSTHKNSPVATGVSHCVPHLITASLLAPIERVQILMQCQNEMIRSGKLSTPYRGMKDCLLWTIKHEGVLALWRGNSLNVLRILTANMFSQMSSPLMLVLKFLPSSYPLEYARTRLANDVRFRATPESQFCFDASNKRSFSNVKYSGVFDVFKKTLKSDGISGVYRGCTMVFAGTMATQIILLEEKAYFQAKKAKKEKVPSWVIYASFFVPEGMRLLKYPFSTVSRRMIMTSGEATKYLDPMDAVRQIVKHEGVASLYKGFTPYAIHYIASLGTMLVILRSLKKLDFELNIG